MLRKLNDLFDEVRLRLLSSEQLQQRVAQALEATHEDDDLSALSAEVQRRLAATTSADERAKLQALATRLVRHKLMRDIKQGAPIKPDSIGISASQLPGAPDAEAKKILTWVLSLPSSPHSSRELEAIEGKRIAKAFQSLDEEEIAQAVAVLIETLSGQSINRAAVAAGVLGHIGPAATPAIPALVQIIRTHKNRSRGDVWAAAWALGRMGEAATEAAPDLIEMLAVKDSPRSIKCAALALGMMGTQAAAAIPAMEKASDDRNVGRIVKLALACVKGEQPVAALEEEMAEEDPLGGSMQIRISGPRPIISEPKGPCMCSVPD